MFGIFPANLAGKRDADRARENCIRERGRNPGAAASGTLWSLMKIESIILREVHMQLKSPFETSFGTVQDRRILLVEVVADGVSGWGEVTTTESPVYNSETTGTAWHIISDFIAPFVIGRRLASASDFPALVGHIRGHEM